MKSTFVKCNNAQEKEAVFSVFNAMGFNQTCDTAGCNNIQFNKSTGNYQTWVVEPNGEELTYEQFMEKYAMIELKKTIEAAKKQGYTNKTLSNALGKYDGYIARIISKPQSEKLQKFLIKEINELLVPAQIDDAMMISKEEYKALNDHNADLLNDNSIKSFQISRLENDVADFKEKARSAKAHSEEVVKYSSTLEKELDHKNQVLDKRNDKYNLLEGEFNELKFHFDNQTKEKEGLIRTINELEQQNKRVVDSNFELSEAISVHNRTIDNLRKKLDATCENYSTLSAMHITSENKRKKERYWFAGIVVALLVLFVISHLV